MQKCLEMRIGYRIAAIIGAMMWLVFGSMCLMQSGCSLLDLDGNGRFDPIAYLQTVDVTVGFVGDDGNVYSIAVDELGAKLAGQFIQAKTGYMFELVDDGGISITAPDGTRLSIAKKG